MRILLVYPPIMRCVGIYSTPLPLGMLQVAAYLQSQGHEVRCLNLEIDPKAKRTTSIREMQDAYRGGAALRTITDEDAGYRNEYAKAMREFGPELVGFSVAHEQKAAVNYLCRYLTPGGMKVIVGGPGIKHELADKALGCEPAIELLAGQNPPESFGAILTSLGCPHACAFCASPQTYGRRVTEYPPEIIHDRIRRARAMGAKAIHIMDDSVTFSPGRALEIAEIMHDEGLPWRTQTRADDLARNPALVLRFKNAGCVQLTMGLESGSDRVRKAMGKQLELTKFKQAIHALEAQGTPYTINVIVGYPTETDDELRETWQVIEQYVYGRVAAFLFVPYPNTRAVLEYPEVYRAAQDWASCEWSPFNPEFLVRDGRRIMGPSVKAIEEFFEHIEEHNNNVTQKSGVSTTS